MKTESSTSGETALPQVMIRLQTLEKQVQFINTRLQFQSTLPRFEFVIEIEGKMIWSGLDLANQYPKIRQQYADKELVISWRSSPMVWI
jgi:hypothetical protein